jgi:hypothetical protein
MSGRAASIYLIRLFFVLSLKKINPAQSGPYLPALAGLVASARLRDCPTAAASKAMPLKVRARGLLMHAFA